jgi:hypothetical protein
MPEDPKQTTIHVGSMNHSSIITGDIKGNVTLNLSGNTTEIDTAQLAAELAQLRKVLKERAETGDHDIAIAEVAKAEQAANTNNLPQTMEHLKAAGKWVFDIASQISIPVAIAALRKALGL